MCGIAGYVGLEADPDLLRRMNLAQRHRGPDAHGTFIDGPVGLAHQRLSVIDAEGGRQPMTADDGRFTLVYNGEVYNYPDLREELVALGQRHGGRRPGVCRVGRRRLRPVQRHVRPRRLGP